VPLVSVTAEGWDAPAMSPAPACRCDHGRIRAERLAAAVTLARAGLTVQVIEGDGHTRRRLPGRRADPARVPSRPVLPGPPARHGLTFDLRAAGPGRTVATRLAITTQWLHSLTMPSRQSAADHRPAWQRSVPAAPPPSLLGHLRQGRRTSHYGDHGHPAAFTPKPPRSADIARPPKAGGDAPSRSSCPPQMPTPPPPMYVFSSVCRKRHLGDKLLEKATFMMRT